MVVVYWYSGVRSVLPSQTHSVSVELDVLRSTKKRLPLQGKAMSAIFVVPVWYDLGIEATPSQSLGGHSTLEPPVTHLGSLIQIHVKLTGHESSLCRVIIMLLLFSQDCTSHKNDLQAGFQCQGNPEWLRGSHAGLSPSWRSGCSLSLLRWTKTTVTRHRWRWSCFNVESVQHSSHSPASSLP